MEDPVLYCGGGGVSEIGKIPYFFFFYLNPSLREWLLFLFFSLLVYKYIDSICLVLSDKLRIQEVLKK